ncbi:N-6 DNA methylase [Vallitalea okinawensis]|uniref:N-6 DNA methylase n=1 Tax=Vallitalea okinawensis TaxID=2078660 RepID=UPI000CFB6A7D|nr:N-6 DNA methylase [Vallitalea okinawensis]
MGRSTVHYADKKTNNILKKLHNKLRPAGTPVQRVEYIIELLLLRIFETKLKIDPEFKEIRKLFVGENETKLFYYLKTIDSRKITHELNVNFFPFYGNILNEARKVLKTNLSIKLQDQLVLIQEVFKNSNFTNNVQSGNLEEVISAVSDIDEARLLNTDLLGDAIESALSEQGGTKDIGLYRTPDHIRQFMVGLIEPTIKDTILDPACGTGGFLFDSFEYVMERITLEDSWPGIKAHPELKNWFKNYFKSSTLDMPSFDESTQFYRSGVLGIEYLGMIRKMAAVNFYIRGLNPNNIVQGDALAMFNYSFQNSKSVILANPPFGAERDQESYPNVWKEFSTESETTILFVKLMLDSLKVGGRCAVIVSEGFLTWENSSAKELRKMLIEHADIKAIISLPQGVFVSKNGQGPKTSIIVFEKGRPTKNIWYYQVDNDGYTKGTNRTPIEGCQLVEALELFHKYIKKGMFPKNSKNSYVVPVEQIKTLDPRIKETIRKDTMESYKIKYEIQQEKLLGGLDKKLSENKIDIISYKEELKQFKIAWDSKCQNEIANRIDKAYIYSFNISTYISDVTNKQISKWRLIARDYLNNENLNIKVNEKYKILSSAKEEEIIPTLAKFDLKNSLESDIVREYVSKYTDVNSNIYEKIKQIDNIFKMGARYPLVSIEDVCDYAKGEAKAEGANDGPYPLVVTAESRKSNSKYQFDTEAVCIPLISSTGHGHASMKRIHYQKGKFSLANILFAIYAKNSNTLNMNYVYHILRYKLDKLFVPLMKGTANVSMKIEDAVKVSFPLPPIEVQSDITNKINKNVSVIKGIDLVLDNWGLIFDNIDLKHSKETLGKLIKINLHSINPKKVFGEDEINYVEIKSVKNGTGIIDYGNKVIGNKAPSRARRQAIPGNVIISSVRPNLRGFAFLEQVPPKTVFSTGYAILEVIDEDILDPMYLYLCFMYSDYIMKQIVKVMEKASYPSINNDDIKSLNIPLPSINEQRKIVNRYKQEKSTINELYKLKSISEQNIKELINFIWQDEKN